MLTGFIIAVALVLGGLAVMRFAIFQIRKIKKKRTWCTYNRYKDFNNF